VTLGNNLCHHAWHEHCDKLMVLTVTTKMVQDT